MEESGRMNKKMILCMALLVGVAMLVQATGKQEPATGTAPQSDVVNFWCIAVANYEPAQKHYIEGFEKASPNIKINVTKFPYEQVYEKLLAAFAAGAEPDACEVMIQAVAIAMRQGKLAPLPENIFPKQKLEDMFSVEALKNVAFRGRYYGLPATGYSVSGGIVYNKKLFREAGVTADQIKTWDDLMVAAKKLTKRSDSGEMVQAGFSMHDNEEAAHYQSFLFTAGGRMLDDDLNPAFNSVLGRKVLQNYVDLFDVQKVDDMKFPGALSATNNFAKGKIAMLMEGCWYMRWMKEAFPFIETDAFPCPTPYAPNPWSPVMFSIEGWYVTQKGDRPASWEFMKYLATPEQMLDWSITTGDITAVKSLWTNPKMLAQDIFKAYLPYLPNTKYVGYVRSGNRWIETVRQMLQKATTHEMSVQDALAWATKEQKTMFEEYDATVPIK
jgi:multiple sugar transport system substrate-binding protein